MTVFSKFAGEWKTDVLPLKKPATQATMASHLREFESEFGDTPVQLLDNQRVQKYVTKLSTFLAPKTVKNRWATLRLILARAKKEGLITQIPEPELPKLFRTPKLYLTIPEVQKLIQGARIDSQTLYRTFYETGLRAGEAFALMPEDLDVSNRVLKVSRSLYGIDFQTPKTPSSIRTISLSKELTGDLENLLDGRTYGTIFQTVTGKRWRQEKALIQLHRDLDNAGLARAGFHAFRRGNATTLAGMGCPEAVISERLGHVPRGLAMNVYKQERLADREWADKLGLLLHEDLVQ